MHYNSPRERDPIRNTRLREGLHAPNLLQCYGMVDRGKNLTGKIKMAVHLLLRQKQQQEKMWIKVRTEEVMNQGIKGG